MDLVLNKRTENIISNYMKGDSHLSQSVILKGEKGLGKYHASLILAEYLLDYKGDDMINHPELHIINPENGLINKDIANEIILLSKYRATSVPRKVFIINDANKMNLNAANSILKIIEDGLLHSVFLFVAHENLLPTIESRCIEIPFYSISYVDYEKYNSQIDKVAWLACNGRLGRYNYIIENGSFHNKLKEFYCVYEDIGTGVELLKVCGALKEKDKNNVYEIFSNDELNIFICFLRSLFIEELIKRQRVNSADCLQILEIIDKALNMMKQKGIFSKNDFFDILRNIIVKNKGEKE